jgi:hypothetical protein
MRAILCCTKGTVVVAAWLVLLSPLLSEAGGLVDDDGVCTRRPLSDFVDAQGTLNNPPQFFPPVRDYLGWTENPAVTFALVDYAGLADRFLGGVLGTKVRGLVLECALRDGTTQIKVSLVTTRALGFAQSVADLVANDFDFLNTPAIFGAKAVSGPDDPGTGVSDGADAAVGPATLFTTFAIAKPGADLPDFLDVVFNSAQYAPVKLRFHSVTFGERSDGTRAHLVVRQTAATDAAGVLIFSEEVVEIVGGHR